MFLFSFIDFFPMMYPPEKNVHFINYTKYGIIFKVQEAKKAFSYITFPEKCQWTKLRIKEVYFALFDALQNESVCYHEIVR